MFSNFSASLFINIKNITPKAKPTVAGINEITPCSSAISTDGKISDQMLAASITPAANPTIILLNFSLNFSPIRKTNPLPKLVPINGIKIPAILYNVFSTFMSPYMI